jgi:hypothetical protein
LRFAAFAIVDSNTSRELWLGRAVNFIDISPWRTNPKTPIGSSALAAQLAELPPDILGSFFWLDWVFTDSSCPAPCWESVAEPFRVVNRTR